MTTSKIVWIILGVTALLGVAVVGTVVAFLTLRPMDPGGVINPEPTPNVELPGVTPMPLGSGQIRGVVWHDLCAAGEALSAAPQGCIATAGGQYLANGVRESEEPGIAGVAVRLGAGACPAVGLSETQTNVDGSFFFASLPAGNYCVSVDPGLGTNAGVLLPGSWSSMVGSPLAMLDLVISDGEARGGLEFGWDYQFLPLAPTASPTPSSSPTPTMTPTATWTPAPLIPCDWLAFVKDVTVPDSTIFSPDQDFKKTWRLRNTGTCTWTKDYDLVFVSGNRMTGDNITPLPASVKPGETIDLSIELTAPLQVGKHTGFWALRNATGVVFGMGPDAKDPFWVTVRVEKKQAVKIVYDLAADYCSATWVSAAGTIDCPSPGYDVAGYVERLDAPVLEGNRRENEQGLWVIPEGVPGGYISGTFPPFKVEVGDRFRGVISCLDGYAACDIQFRLEYRVGSGEVKTLGKWRERNNGEFTKLDVDLSPLAGKNVQFILTVRALDVYDQDSGVWLRPSIWR